MATIKKTPKTLTISRQRVEEPPKVTFGFEHLHNVSWTDTKDVRFFKDFLLQISKFIINSERMANPNKTTTCRLCFSIGLLMFVNNSYAGIDWSRYGDGPDFFLGWETSFYFAIATFSLLGLSYFLVEKYKGKDGGTPEGSMGCFISILNVAMIICAICSFYLLIPLAILYMFFKGNKK